MLFRTSRLDSSDWWKLSLKNRNKGIFKKLSILQVHSKSTPANFFSVKCTRFFVSTEPEFPKIYQRPSKDCQSFWKTSEDDFWRLPKIAEDFPTTSKDNRRCRKILNDFKTGHANDFQRISNQSWALLKSFEVVVTTPWTFLSNYTRYRQLGMRNWSEYVRSQF